MGARRAISARWWGGSWEKRLPAREREPLPEPCFVGIPFRAFFCGWCGSENCEHTRDAARRLDEMERRARPRLVVNNRKGRAT